MKSILSFFRVPISDFIRLYPAMNTVLCFDHERNLEYKSDGYTYSGSIVLIGGVEIQLYSEKVSERIPEILPKG